MRLAAGLLLILLLTNVVFRPLVTITSFVIHQEQIAEELCENRMKPDVLCYGTCVLQKELAQQFQEKNSEEGESQVLPLEELKYTLPDFEEEESYVLEKFKHLFRWQSNYDGIALLVNSPPPIFV